MSSLQVYKRDSKCIKCGNAEASSAFHAGELSFSERLAPLPPVLKAQAAMAEELPDPQCSLLIGKEHIHRKCARCGYEWGELPLDSEEPPKDDAIPNIRPFLQKKS